MKAVEAHRPRCLGEWRSSSCDDIPCRLAPSSLGTNLSQSSQLSRKPPGTRWPTAQRVLYPPVAPKLRMIRIQHAEIEPEPSSTHLLRVEPVAYPLSLFSKDTECGNPSGEESRPTPVVVLVRDALPEFDVIRAVGVVEGPHETV